MGTELQYTKDSIGGVLAPIPHQELIDSVSMEYGGVSTGAGRLGQDPIERMYFWPDSGVV
jgi:hypothetical protein